MNLSQKCQYSIRAILELAKRYGQGAVPTAEIAARQAIPRRFLEIILNELKPSGLVGSVRGARGGYYLARDPKEITVGHIIRMVDGPLEPVRCTGDKDNAACELLGRCSLNQLWHEARVAVERIYDAANFHDLAQRDRQLGREGDLDFCI